MASFYPLESYLKQDGYDLIAGIDEAGRGPLAGPVVSAAVLLKENAKIKGLKDSKLLTAKKREELFEIIIKSAKAFTITFVSHVIIDEINILNATRLANELCVKYLKIKPQIILIDGNDRQFIKKRYINIIKGDRYVKSIAAASVLAKVARDRLMDHYAKSHSNYEFSRHKGYGTRRHKALIKKHGLCEIHRKSYNSTHEHNNSR